MEKQINFRTFKEASEIQKLLEGYLAVGTASSSGVFSFLEKQNLDHSRLIDNTKYSSLTHSLPFDHLIGATAPAKRFMLVFEAKWMIRFYFDENTLAHIEVEWAALAL